MSSLASRSCRCSGRRSSAMEGEATKLEDQSKSEENTANPTNLMSQIPPLFVRRPIY